MPDYLLLESGDRLLLESGDRLLLESISLPLIDGGEVFAPSFSQDQTIALPLIDGGVVFAPVLSSGDTGLSLAVAGVAVASSFARSFEEQLADTGSFSFQVLRDDFTGIDFDDPVTFSLDGVPRFRGFVESLDHVALSQGEEAEQTVTISGRGAAGILDQHVVYPSRGVGALPIEEVRSFSVYAPDFDLTTIPLAKKVNRQRDYATWRAPLPWIWPDTTGWWIAPNIPTVTAVNAPTGQWIGGKDFTLADAATVRIFGAGDNSLVLYVDGAPMSEGRSFTVGRYVELELSAGSHTIRFRGNNYPKATLPNPTGVIIAAYTVGDAGLLDDLIVHTDHTWRAMYATSLPGFTYGQVLRILFEEAGLDSDWTLGFTDTLDSDGNLWPVQTEITVTVGRTLLEVLREMGDTDIDWQVAPGSLTLRAWSRGGRGSTRSVTLQQTTSPGTSDFLALSHTGKRTRLNKALVRYAGGHTEKTDSGSVGSHGVRGGYLELGAVQSASKAQAVADALMDNRDQPAYSTAATLHPRGDGTTPYRAFEVGDFVTCPDETDTPALMRVMSIALTEDDEGVLDWPVQFRDQQLELEERHQVWLRRMADGALLGGARVSSRAGTPPAAEVEVTGLRVAEFSYDNSALTVSSSPKRAAEVSGNIVEVQGTLTTAGSTSTVVAVALNGSTIATLTFAAGVDETETAVSVLPVKANVDKLQVSITTAGTGAEGLDVQVRAV